MKNENTTYTTSRDYKRLKELLDEGKKIACFIDYVQVGYTWRDICLARKTKSDFEPYKFSVRGHVYAAHQPSLVPYSFEELAAAYNVEFIEPDAPDPWHETAEDTDDVPQLNAACLLRIEYKENATDIVEVDYLTATWGEYGWTEEFLDNFDASEYEVKITHWQPINKPKGTDK